LWREIARLPHPREARAMKILKIQMLDYDGEPSQVVRGVHTCTGNLELCQDAAYCMRCGENGTPEKPVYVWTVGADVDYFSCAACLPNVPARLISSVPRVR